MKKPTGLSLCATGVVACALLLSLAPIGGAAEAPLPGNAAKSADSASPETQATTNASAEVQLSPQAMDQIRREIENSAARNAEAITAGLSIIEPMLARLQDRQMEAVHDSNRTILIVAGIFAAVGFLGLLLITLILVRALGRFSELAVLAAPHGPTLGSGHTLAALGSGEKDRSGGTAEQASARFQGAIDHLQKRILELEHTLQPSRAENVEAPQSTRPAAAPSKPNVEPLDRAVNIQPLLAHNQPSTPPAAQSGTPAPRVPLLLGKGQALLNLDAAEQALECFEELLALEPGHADALVKRGMALEKLQEWERAVESYDRAIAADASFTVAYLYKGGVCNRLQRYREALESYEQALRTEKKSRAS